MSVHDLLERLNSGENIWYWPAYETEMPVRSSLISVKHVFGKPAECTVVGATPMPADRLFLTQECALRSKAAKLMNDARQLVQRAKHYEHLANPAPEIDIDDVQSGQALQKAA